jgi:hypothetical protein
MKLQVVGTLAFVGMKIRQSRKANRIGSGKDEPYQVLFHDSMGRSLLVRRDQAHLIGAKKNDRELWYLTNRGKVDRKAVIELH